MSAFGVLQHLWAVVAAPVSCGFSGPADRDAEMASLALVAAAQEAVTNRDDPRALACLDAAKTASASALVSAERAFVLYRLARYEEALAAVQRSVRLGNVDPEAHLLEAEILSALGRPDAARESARRVRSWEGNLVGASLGDVAATYASGPHVAERTERGALTALTLGARALEEGNVRSARRLLEAAEKNADLVAARAVRSAASELLERARETSSWRWSARLGSAIDFTTNPGFRSRGDPDLERGLRVALTAEGALAADLGSLRTMLAVRLDQHVFLAPRDIPVDLDIFGLNVSGGVELPLSRDPSFVVLGLSLRFSDLFADKFARHYALSFEGGPYLRLRLGPRLWTTFGFFGVVTEFVDDDLGDAAFSSLDRDRAGQRGMVGIRYVADWLDVRVDGMFIRDDAVGDAFDGIGGAVSVRLEAHLEEEGLQVFAGLALNAMEYGPIGDSAIIGPAATRTELRTVAEGGVRFPMLAHLDLIVQDTWINNAARTGHAYTENILSMGLEVWW